jgi:tetratricopeptide (TPR) repeat protein
MSEKFPNQTNYGKTVNIVGDVNFADSGFSQNKAIQFVDLPNLDTTVYGRDAEAKILADFFAANKRHCAVVAPSCFGKTFLIRKFLQNVSANSELFKDSFEKVIYFNCREITGISSVVDKFETCLGEKFEAINLLAYIQNEKILCIFDNFESWIKQDEFTQFIHKIFNTQNKLSTIFVTQKMPNDDNFQAEELIEISRKLFKGLDQEAAVEFVKTEGKKAKLDLVEPEKLISFFEEVAYIPQAIRSMIKFLEIKRKSFDEFIATFKTGFAEFEKSKDRFNDVNDEFRPTLYLLTLQIETQDERAKDLLSVLSFFGSEVPELVIEKFKPAVSSIEKEVIHSLIDNWLVEESTVWRGKTFRYYSPHFMIRQVVRESMLKFENKYSDSLESLAIEFFAAARGNHDGMHNYEEASNIYRCVEKLLVYLVNNKGRSQLTRDLAGAYLNNGVSLASLGKLSEAIIEFDKASEKLKNLVLNGQSEFPNDLASAFLNKGNVLRSLGKVNEAIIEYDKSIEIREGLIGNGVSEIENDLASAYLNKGAAFGILGRERDALSENDKAIAIYELLVASGRTELKNWLALSYLNKGVLYDGSSDFIEAIIEFDKAIIIFNDLVVKGRSDLVDDLRKAFMNKGVSLSNLDRLSEAIIEFDKAILILKELIEQGRNELANDLSTAHMNKGVALRSLGKFNESIIEHDKAIGIRKGLFDTGRYELASELALLYMNKGVPLEGLGKLTDAIEFYTYAIDLFVFTMQRKEFQNLPNLAVSLGNRLNMNRQLGSYNLALEDMQRLHELLEFTKRYEGIEHHGKSIQHEIDKRS